MRRHLWMKIVLCVLSALCAAGCSAKTTLAPSEPVVAETGMRRTMLYYQDKNELLVPVMKRIPWEEGIGKAALNNLTDTPENAQSASALGLKAVLPKDTSFDLRINEGVACVDIIDAGKFETMQAENNAICAVVNTLMEFPSINEVKVTFDGKGKKTQFGTDLSTAFHKLDVNVETASMLGESISNKVVLYFADLESEINIPVTRYLYDTPDLYCAVLELIKGPADTEVLQTCFPEGTQLLDVNVINGEAVISFSKEFENIREYPLLEQRALATLYLTCRQFDDVDSVRVKVENKDYDPYTSTMAPTYINAF